MDLARWEQEGRLRRHRTSRREIADLLGVAEQALRDARVKAVSLDRRFTAAYDAARSLADAVLAAAGWRAVGVAQHLTAFEALLLVMGPEYADLSAYLDACRLKRNVAEYRRAGQITEAEVNELIAAVEDLRPRVEALIRR